MSDQSWRSPGAEHQVRQALRAFGAELRAVRLRHGMTLAAVAREVLSNKSSVSRVENGLISPHPDFAAACDRLFQTGTTFQVLAAAVVAEPCLWLPPGLRELFGRDEELARLDQWCGDGRGAVVVVDGPPGVGKTALVLRWAHDVLARFDRVAYADLRGFCAGSPSGADDVLEQLLVGLGVPAGRIPAEVEHRAAVLRGLVAGTRSLIVLDNAADAAQVAPVLPGVPGCVVVITSRTRLGELAVTPGARHLSVQPLGEAAAGALLADMIGRDRVDAEPGVARVVLGRLAGFPLALRIAGEYLDMCPELPLGGLAGVDVLAGPGGAVRSAFACSYRALAPGVRRMFRLLGLFPGARLRLGAAAALAGLGEAETQVLLDELRRGHLLTSPGYHVFAFHDLIRVFAAEEAGRVEHAAESAAAVERLCSWYVRGVAAAGRVLTPYRAHLDPATEQVPGVPPVEFSDEEAAFRWCAGELANITAVTGLAREAGLLRQAWLIPTELVDFFMVARPWEVWIAATTIGLEAAEQAGDPGGIAVAGECLAEPYRRRHDLDRAERLYRRVIEVAEPLGPGDALGWAYIGLGNIAHERGDYAGAAWWQRRAITVNEAIDFPVNRGGAHVHLGRALRELGDHDGAFFHGRAAYEIFRDWGDGHALGYVLVPLARTARHFGDPAQALVWAGEALVAYRSCGDLWGIAAALEESGRALDQLGRTGDAREVWQDAVGLVAELDPDKAAVIRTLIEATATASSERVTA